MPVGFLAIWGHFLGPLFGPFLSFYSIFGLLFGGQKALFGPFKKGLNFRVSFFGALFLGSFFRSHVVERRLLIAAIVSRSF